MTENRSNTVVDAAERTLVIERTFDAPRDLVWKAWTDPARLVQWWGPNGFTTPSCRMDVRPGGRYRMHLRSPEGKDYWMQGEYREVVEPERLVFTFAWEDENGDPVHETLATVSLAERDGKTEFRFHQALFRTEKERDDHDGGWSECFDRLAAYAAAHATEDGGAS